MLKVVWNILKYLIGSVFSIFRPLRRLICQRRKSSETDGAELTSIGTGNLMLETPQAYPTDGDGAEIELESWDTWDMQSQQVPGYKSSSSHPAGHKGDSQMNGVGIKIPQGFIYNKKETHSPDPEPEINFFEDMTPRVKKQPKILIRKKDTSISSATTSVSNRLTVMSDVPISNSELEAWQDEINAWDAESASDDLVWQAEEAIKENKRKERMERHLEQLKKKQKKEETRGSKSGPLLATKLS